MARFGAGFGGSMPEYYDRILGPAQFEPLGDDLVRRVPPKPAGDVLEIACGTGLVSRRLRERLDPTVKLHATDLSEAMLAYARGKVPGAIGWQVADASALPFADALHGVWDRIERNPHGRIGSEALEGWFPDERATVRYRIGSGHAARAATREAWC